jgi:hypothetical protein
MMRDLTFTRALVLFTVIMIPVYLALLMLSGKITKQRGELTHSATLSIVVVSLFSVEALTMSLLHVPSFRTTLMYSVLLLLIAGLLLYGLRSSPTSNRMRMLFLLSVIVYHIALLYSPPFGISIHERTGAAVKLSLEGRWDPSWGFLHPTYNPFPMDIGLSSMVSVITSIPHISQLKDWIFLLPFIVTYDLVLYSLTKRVTGSQVAGILAILLLSSTPPANILFHGPQWIGNLLVLISALALIKAFDGSSPISNIIVADISYTAAIFTHTSAAIGVFLPLGVVAISYLAKQVVSRGVWTRLFSSRLFRVAFTLFAVVTLARAIHTAGYLGGIIPALENFVLTMFGYSPPSEAYTSVYEQAVSPVNAYAWSTPVAMASALVIHSLLKRRAMGGALTLIMCLVGAGFAFLGFLVALVKAGGFQGAMYPAFVFLIPAAAVVGKKVLRSSRAIAIAIMVLMVLSVGIALTDPMMSPQRYRETGAGNIAPGMEDYVEARFLVDVIPSSKTLMAQYEIMSCFSYLMVAEGKPPHPRYTSSADLQRIIIDRVVRDKELLPGVMYIWPRRLLPDIKSHLADVPINVYYDSGRYTILEKVAMGI